MTGTPQAKANPSHMRQEYKAKYLRSCKSMRPKIYKSNKRRSKKTVTSSQMMVNKTVSVRSRETVARIRRRRRTMEANIGYNKPIKEQILGCGTLRRTDRRKTQVIYLWTGRQRCLTYHYRLRTCSLPFRTCSLPIRTCSLPRNR